MDILTDQMLDTLLDTAPKGHVERTLMWLLDDRDLILATQSAANSVTGEG